MKVSKLFDGITQRNCRASLARAITLIESTTSSDNSDASILLDRLLNVKKKKISKSVRIGIAGPPGAGKSSFIDKLGQALIEKSPTAKVSSSTLSSQLSNNSEITSSSETGTSSSYPWNRVAVLAVDPSSSISGGSILGDKTRMNYLATSKHAIVRPAPSRCLLGGITEHSRDIMMLCEAAGYNIVIVETVGLGQSEIDVDLAVDMVILLVSPGGGDSLQAAKKGIMEIADLIVVNKADGPLLSNAQHTAADYSGSLQFLRQKHAGSLWKPQVVLASAVTGLNVDKIISIIFEFAATMTSEGRLSVRRAQQDKHWLRLHLQRGLLRQLESHPTIQDRLKDAEIKLDDSNCNRNSKEVTSPRAVAQQILKDIDILVHDK